MHAFRRSYRCAPHGEYLITHLASGGLDIIRGHQRYPMSPGDLAVWDPSATHRVRSATHQPGETRALIIEQPTARELGADPDGCAPDLHFPHPVLRNPTHTANFLRLHRTMTSPASILEQQTALTVWLAEITQPTPTHYRSAAHAARRDPALHTACQLLHDRLATDIDLPTLAAAAATSTYRLIRLFNAGLRLPPHSYQIQIRVQRARTLLETGHTPAEVTHLVGFYDQSHLSRHFTRRIGLTPAQYARTFRQQHGR